MRTSGLEKIHIVFGEQDVNVRRTVTGSLHSHGYRGIRGTDKIEGVHFAVRHQTPDVLICDVRLGDDALIDLIYRIRHDEIGHNPFMIVIVIANDPTPEMVRRIVNSGADDLILRPVSVGKLLDRLTYLTHKRKGFVVTTDYIGPNRRKNPRPGTQQIPIIDVPNSLKFKTEGNANPSTLRNSIIETTQIVNEQKMERHAFQVDCLVNKIVPQYVEGTADDAVLPLISRLHEVTENLARRAAGADQPLVCDLCESMIEVTGSIKKSPLSPKIEDVNSLQKLGAAIKQAFMPGEGCLGDTRDAGIVSPINPSVSIGHLASVAVC